MVMSLSIGTVLYLMLKILQVIFFVYVVNRRKSCQLRSILKTPGARLTSEQVRYPTNFVTIRRNNLLFFRKVPTNAEKNFMSVPY